MTHGAARLLWTGVAMLAVAACSTTPKRSGEPAPRAAASSAGASAASSASRRGGGYYLDDGPGDGPPPNLELLPDAVPRVEKYASGANRPYNVFGVDYVPDLSGAPYRQRGVGSWYGRKFHGQRTSSGEIYDMYAMTAAHPTLPIPSYALVTNLQNGRSVIVRVNDRGPFLHNRVMDLSYAAAYKLGYMSSGSGMIEVERLMPADIAAGRIPATTTGLLAAASMSNAPLAGSMRTAPSWPAADAASASLTIEALTASAERPTPSHQDTASGHGMLPAPTFVDGTVDRSPAESFVTMPSIDRSLATVVPTAVQLATALPEVATGAGFYLQLGAFRVKAGADSFAAHVAREIDPAVASRVHVVATNGLYRVRLGPYTRRADADSAAATLKAAISQPLLMLPDGPSER